MTKHHPVTWLKGRTTTGLKDMPSNAARVARRARRSSSNALGPAINALSGAGGHRWRCDQPVRSVRR
jgi:hypothetical protein